MKYAIIEDGVVTNIAVADAPIADNWIEAGADAVIGGTWDGKAFGPIPAPDPAEVVAAWRQTADMEKGAFCIALMRARVLPADEAVAAAKGEWPATFASAISGLPVDADEAAIIWAATTRVRRLHPILLALIPKSPLTDADVDAMFGWKS